VNNLGATDAEKAAEQAKRRRRWRSKKAVAPDSILNWTGTLLVGLGETLVLLYLLRPARATCFCRMLVRVDAHVGRQESASKSATMISKNISNYLFSVRR